MQHGLLLTARGFKPWRQVVRGGSAPVAVIWRRGRRRRWRGRLRLGGRASAAARPARDARSQPPSACGLFGWLFTSLHALTDCALPSRRVWQRLWPGRHGMAGRFHNVLTASCGCTGLSSWDLGCRVVPQSCCRLSSHGCPTPTLLKAFTLVMHKRSSAITLAVRR